METPRREVERQSIRCFLEAVCEISPSHLPVATAVSLDFRIGPAGGPEGNIVLGSRGEVEKLIGMLQKAADHVWGQGCRTNHSQN